MTARNTWKQRERDVADFFHGQRNPLSGRNSKHIAADVIHDRLFIECKLREKHSAVSLWDEVKALADREGKTPVVVLCEKNRPGFWVLVHSEDLSKL
jgi:hypothetical protein